MAKDHTFEVVQDGMVVASVTSRDRMRALRDAMHYMLIYSQDGPTEMKGVTPKDWEMLNG